MNDLVKALFGDEESEVVKSGTFAVTRLTGWVAAVFVLIGNTELFGLVKVGDVNKLWASIAIIAVFAFIGAADILARGYITARTQSEIRTLPTPLKVRVGAKSGSDETGWRAVLARFDPLSPEDLEFWIVKGGKAEWIKSTDLAPE